MLTIKPRLLRSKRRHYFYFIPENVLPFSRLATFLKHFFAQTHMGIELSTEPSMKQQNTATLRNLVATADFSTLTHDEHIHIVSFLNHAFPNYCSGAGVQLVMKAKKYFSHSHGQQPSNSAYTLWLAYEKRLYTHSPCRKCLLAADSTIS